MRSRAHSSQLEVRKMGLPPLLSLVQSICADHVTQNMEPSIRYWDRVAHQKRFSHPLQLNWLERSLDRQARILDYGCGYGRTLAELESAGFEKLIGVDFSTGMLARAKALSARAEFICNDGRPLPFREGVVDLVAPVCCAYLRP